ncbi:MAG TPA: GNAT family N-acetyltransferase, partial [Sphingobacteriaceae bacterium]
ERPVWKAFVAECNGVVQGFALYYIRYSTWKGCRLYLEDFLVTEEMRGRGIGKLLFDRIVREAREKGFNGMTWQVLDWNEPAINFYNKYQAHLEAGWLNVSLSKEQISA